MRGLKTCDGNDYVAPRAFLDMFNAIYDAKKFVYVTGWSVNVNTKLVRTEEGDPKYHLTVGQLLKKKVSYQQE